MPLEFINENSEYWWRQAAINRRAWTWEDAHTMQRQGEWWQHAVIYQIFPWSFMDSDANGIGDLPGILSKLDYVKSLGVDAVWLTPIYPSEHDDAGYDVKKLDAIDPLFGTMADFENLLTVAHDFELKVLIDQVWNHTSNEHPWFRESSASQDNPKADWYVWADPAPEGGPPNNWLSAFTGDTAWCWHKQRRQYYLANFLPGQPELNWHNEAVVEALLERAKFWLDKGVDGFRIDAVNFFYHDPDLEDNPKRIPEHGLPDGIDPNNPMASQHFSRSFCRPETLHKLKRIRQLVDQYPHVVTLGEVTLCEDSIDLSGQYVEGSDRLHLAYNSALLQDEPITTKLLRQVTKRISYHFPEGGQCWMVGNHDYQRLRSRWTGKDVTGEPYPKPFYHMIAGLLVALPGAVCLYQGDELGLPEARIPEDIPPEQLKDPFGKALYPKLPGRDVSRTPMPWCADAPNAGFTTAAKSWLPVPQAHHDLAIDRQNADPKSLLNTWRRLLHWRQKQPALIAGDFQTYRSDDRIFAFIRRYAEQSLLCLFNLSPHTTPFSLPELLDKSNVQTLLVNQSEITLKGEELICSPYAAVFLSTLES